MIKQINRIISFCIVSILILSGESTANSMQPDSVGKTFSFSLKEAKEFALQNNTDIKNAKVDKLIAKKQVWETTAIGLPQASASYKFQHLPGDIPTFELGPGQEVALGVENSATYDFTLSQLIFSGEYIVGLQASRTFLQLSDNSLRKNLLEVESTTSSNYYSILVLEKNKEILDSSIINFESIAHEMQAIQEVGLLQKTDADQIQLTLNMTKNASVSLQRQIEIMYKFFKISLGLALEDEVELTDDLNTFMLNLNIESLLASQVSLENNIDYQIINTQEKISSLSLKREQSKFLPSVSAFYLYQDKTNKADFDFTINQIIGVNINVPVFSSGQKYSKVQQAKLDLTKMQNNKELVAESLKMQIDQTRFDLMNAYDNFQTQKENIKLSETIYKNTYTKHKEGLASSMELSQAHQQYLTEQTNYFNSVLELLNTKQNLEKLINQ